MIRLFSTIGLSFKMFKLNKGKVDGQENRRLSYHG